MYATEVLALIYLGLDFAEEVKLEVTFEGGI